VLMAGQDVPRLFCSATDPDGGFDGAVPDLDVTADDSLNRHGRLGQ
jgi:hypothetical protein